MRSTLTARSARERGARLRAQGYAGQARLYPASEQTDVASEAAVNWCIVHSVRLDGQRAIPVGRSDSGKETEYGTASAYSSTGFEGRTFWTVRGIEVPSSFVGAEGIYAEIASRYDRSRAVELMDLLRQLTGELGERANCYRQSANKINIKAKRPPPPRAIHQRHVERRVSLRRRPPKGRRRPWRPDRWPWPFAMAPVRCVSCRLRYVGSAPQQGDARVADNIAKPNIPAWFLLLTRAGSG